MVDRNGIQIGGPTRCEVCGIQVSFSQANLKKSQGYVVCHAMACQRIMKQKPSILPRQFQYFVEKQRSFVQAKLAAQAAESHRIDKIHAQVVNENKEIRQLMAIRNPNLPENTHLINLTSGLSTLSAPSKDRIASYKTHLQDNIREAQNYSSVAELTDDIELNELKKCLKTERKLEANPELHLISNQMCSVCKGDCCSGGRDHAFISFSTIRGFMDANPTLTEEEVLDAYMSRIEPETVENSCINHTKTGCGLPREMRSDTCKCFYCDEIKSYHREFAGSNREVKPVIIVQRAHTLSDRWKPDASHDVVGAYVVDPQKVEPIDLADCESFKNTPARAQG